MDRKDYLKETTAKIYNLTQKRKIQIELEDHIESNKEFQESIGYENAEAEKIAIEKMGLPQDIADDFDKLYRDSYSPFWDIMGGFLWGTLIAGLYVVLYNCAVDDIGGNILVFGLSMLLTAVYFLFSALTFKRLCSGTIVANIIGAVATAVFQLLSYCDIQKLNASSLKNFLLLLFKGEVCADSSVKNNYFVLIPVALFLIVAVAIAIKQSVTLNKFNNCETTKKDNKTKHILIKILCFLSMALFLIACFTGFRFYVFISEIKEKYVADYNMVLDISKNCETLDDVEKYIKNNKLKFEPMQNNGKTTGYTYNRGIAGIIIYAEESKKDEQINPIVKRIAQIVIKNTNLDEILSQRYDYIINFSFANLNKFKNIENSISLVNIRNTSSDLNQIYDTNARDTLTNEENWTFYGSFIPSNAVILPSNDIEKHDTLMELTYNAGFGKDYLTTDFEVSIYSNRYIRAKEKIKEIKNAIQNNESITINQLAKQFNAKIIPPDESYDEYKKDMKDTNEWLYDGYDEAGLGDYKDELTEDDIKYMYQEEYEYKIDDNLSYNIAKKYVDGKEYTDICFFSRTMLIYDNFTYPESEENKNKYLASQEEVGVYKVKTPNGYYSSKGVAYEKYESVPYYDSKGVLYTVIPGEDDSSVLYYIFGANGDKHDYKECYIDKDGYIVFDKKGEFREIFTSAGETVHKYKDKKGNVYTKVFETNWNEKGELIDYNDYV